MAEGGWRASGIIICLFVCIVDLVVCEFVGGLGSRQRQRGQGVGGEGTGEGANLEHLLLRSLLHKNSVE